MISGYRIYRGRKKEQMECLGADSIIMRDRTTAAYKKTALRLQKERELIAEEIINLNLYAQQNLFKPYKLALFRYSPLYFLYRDGKWLHKQEDLSCASY